MPIYDYKCNECDTVFSITGSFSSLLGCKPSCPCCHTENVKKMIGKVGIVYKGKDFYTTENRKKEEENNTQ